ncbi:major facilitator superfamily domain-containing protein [Aspergillus parasiticus]|uniref:Major facilitator superfamily domain-containing protein n=1 Tax=Aspergillus parasiticus TaxID=5067 RepID=A0A5N6DVC1_ASPPA|nr:major facilitator superfamily domain-containing protein [Aspergillus parasiticus]
MADPQWIQKEESHSTATLRDSQNSDQQESEPQYPGPLKLTLIIISLNLAMFLVGLDNTIISSAIPKITDQFHALGDVGWYASAYLLTNCAFQLIWGKLFTFYVVKWVYLTALFIFELGSLICAVAPSSTALIVGRAIAGIGGGGVGNGSFLLIAHCVPPRQRPAFIGMMGSMYGIASIAGPLMGGAFTDNISWRWCFYINLPLGVLPAVIITFFIAPFRGSKKGEVGFLNQLKQMDLPGTACLLPGVVCLLLALQWGGSTYPWRNGRIIALFVLSGLLFIAFIVIQYISGDRATVPGRVFSNRNVWGSALFGSCVTAGFFLLLYYIPIWLQAVKGASAIKSGIMNLPMLLGSVIFSLLGGTFTSIIGYYMPFAYLTVILMSIGSGLLSTLQVDSGHAQWIGYQFLVGAGVGSGLQTAFAAPQCVLALEDIPIGTAVVIFTENLSAAVFVSVAQNVFSNQLRTNLATYVPEADASTILSGGATDIKNLVPQELYQAVLFAYNKALDQTFYVGVALSCCAVLGVLGMQWVSVKKKDDTPSE